MPLPRKPTGQAPQDQEPSGKLLHWAPGKQGLDKQPSAWEDAGGVSWGSRSPSHARKDAPRGSAAGN